MPSNEELSSRLQGALAVLAVASGHLKALCASVSSSSADPQTSSPTPPTESGGGTSALQTGGLTAQQVNDVVQTFEDGMSVEAWTDHIKTLMRARLRRILSSYVSAACASGGTASQPRPSDARPDSARGGYSAPTSQSAPCVPIPTETFTDLREVLRMVDGLLCGSLAKSAGRLSDSTLGECSLAMREVKSIMARLRMLT